MINQDLEGFNRFVRDNSLEVEWGGLWDDLNFVPTDKVVPWLLQPEDLSWVLVGRLLKRGKDALILEDPFRLKQVIESVFTGFRPIWEQTQIMSKINAGGQQ